MGEKKKKKERDEPVESRKKSSKINNKLSKEFDEEKGKGKKKDKKIKKKKTIAEDDDNSGDNEKKPKRSKEKKPKKDKKLKKKGKKTQDDDGDITKKKKKPQKTEEEIETVCCICKEESVDSSTGGLCDHVFCLDCLENLLHKPIKDPQVSDNHLAAPTLGRCPECQAELRKFEMKDTTTGKLKYKRQKEISEAPFQGKVYQPLHSETQLGNFCFDKEKPYMDFRKAKETDKDMFLLNDGSPVPDTNDFDKGCYFDESTRTFHGTISWGPVTFAGAHTWSIVIGFTRDFADLHVGVIHERKERLFEKKEADKFGDELNRYQYPLDGKYKLLWTNTQGSDQTGSVTVRNNEFHQGPYLFNLNFDDLEKPNFRWPLDPVYASATSGVNLKKKPMGPKVGDRIVWETTHPAFKEIIWERETIGLDPPPSTMHFGKGNNEYTSDESRIQPIGKDGGVEKDSSEMNHAEPKLTEEQDYGPANGNEPENDTSHANEEEEGSDSGSYDNEDDGDEPSSSRSASQEEETESTNNSE